MATKIVKNLVPALLRAMKALAEKEVLIGIPAGSPDNTRDDAPITNAQIGLINEMGAPEMNIPARPFLVPGVAKAWPEAQRRMAKGAQRVLKLQPGADAIVESALEGAGLIAQGEVVQMINDGLQPALAPTTLADRKSRGFAGEKPLIVTGALKQAITYVVDDAEPLRSV